VAFQAAVVSVAICLALLALVGGPVEVGQRDSWNVVD